MQWTGRVSVSFLDINAFDFLFLVIYVNLLIIVSNALVGMDTGNTLSLKIC